MKRLIGILLLLSSAAWAQKAIRNGDPLDVSVTSVTAVPPGPHETRKPMGLYRVNLKTDHATYTAYCTKDAPEAGKDYQALDEYVDADYSFFHLWPVDRRDVMPGAKKGRLYRIIIFENVHEGKHPDVGCDLLNETKN